MRPTPASWVTGSSTVFEPPRPQGRGWVLHRPIDDLCCVYDHDDEHSLYSQFVWTFGFGPSYGPSALKASTR